MVAAIRRHSPWPVAALAALAFVASGVADARAIYKCTLPDGKTTFSDAPCKETTSQQELQMRGGTTQVAGPSADVQAAAAAKAAKRAEGGDCYEWQPPEGNLTVEQPHRIDPDQLPHDADGKPVEIFVSKRTPTTVAAACSAMVSACSQKSDQPETMMDACFKSAPRCASERPWEEPQACCPQACWDKYVDLRRHCADPSSASYKALFEARCVPGTAAAGQ